MTFDEAIAHAKEVAEIKHEQSKEYSKYSDEYFECEKCAEEHEQLAEWLKELKTYREIGTVQQCKNSVLDITKAYNMAIDDYKDKLLYQIGDLGIRDIIQETAEQLKAGGNNE